MHRLFPYSIAVIAIAGCASSTPTPQPVDQCGPDAYCECAAQAGYSCAGTCKQK